jgi:polysaccharide biosynthesis protein PslH
MRVLLLCNRVPFPINDGWAVAITQQIKVLKAQKCSVTLLCFNTSKHWVKEEDIKSFESSFGVQILTVNLKNHLSFFGLLFNVLTFRSYHITRFWSKEYCRILTNTLKLGFDVVQIETLPMMLYVDSITNHFSGKVFYRAHNIEHLIWSRIAQNTSNLLKKCYLLYASYLLKRFELKSLAKGVQVICISAKDEQIIQSLGLRISSLTIPSSINQKYFEVPLSTVKNAQVGFLGALDWMPNQEGIYWLIDKVLPLLKSKDLDFQINIAGKNTPHQLFKLSSSYVNIMGEVPDIVEFYAKQQIVIIPLHSGSGMKLKLAEAMALGKPIIATNIACEGFDIQHRVHYLSANSPQEFADAIALLLANEQLCTDLSNNARTWAYEHCSSDVIGNAFMKLYKS